LVPLFTSGLEYSPESGGADLVGAGFEIVEGGLWLEGVQIGFGHVKTGKFRHRVGISVVDFNDQEADTAHDGLLSRCRML
jgi:hypothetical protein